MVAAVQATGFVVTMEVAVMVVVAGQCWEW